MRTPIIISVIVVLTACRGADGSDGEQGPQGAQGEQGPAGDQGEQGAAGQDGEDGETGAAGEDGADASPSVVYLEGAQLNRIDDTMMLSWTRVDDNTFASYEVRSSDQPGVAETDTLIAEVTQRDNTDYQIDFGSRPTAYSYYRVFTKNTDGEVVGSNEVGLKGLHLPVRTFGSSGFGDGQTDYVGDVAVDSAGNCFLADSGNARVVMFDSAGIFVRNITPDTGDLSTPYMLEVGPDDTIYVSGNTSNSIHLFDGSGATLDTWDTLSSPADMAVFDNGDVVVADESTVKWLDDSGTSVTEWSANGSTLWDVEHAGGGFVWVLDNDFNEVMLATPSGLIQDTWSLGGDGFGQVSDAWGFGVAPNGHLYVSDWDGAVNIYRPDGLFVGELDDEAWSGIWGIDFDADGNLYVVSADTDTIHVYGP